MFNVVLRPLRSAWRMLTDMLAVLGEAIVTEVAFMDDEEPKVNVDELPKRDVSADEFRAAAVAAQWEVETIRLLLGSGPLPRGYLKVGEEMLRLRA